MPSSRPSQLAQVAKNGDPALESLKTPPSTKKVWPVINPNSWLDREGAKCLALGRYRANQNIAKPCWLLYPNNSRW